MAQVSNSEKINRQEDSANLVPFNATGDERAKEAQEELTKAVAEKSAPVEIDNTLLPKEQLKQRLENGIRSVLDSENFKNWLSTGGKLFYNNYSFKNAMLVWLQKPDATYVMGYENWKEYGRNVGQGAHGAKIFMPIMASEKYKGGLFRSIKSNLNEQLSKNLTLTQASYKLGTTNLEFTMNRSNHLLGFKVNGKEQQIFRSDEEAKRFIDRTIIGKIPTGFTIGTVFDVKDVIIPEYLWVKNGFTKEEIVTDDKGNPIKNRKGETKIINTRQARFQTNLDTRIVGKDPIKMQRLFEACIAVSERKGVPVILSDKESDNTLNGGALGYFSREFSEKYPNGFIVINKELDITERCAVLLHEMGHADLHKSLEQLAQKMGEEKIPKAMREVQAEAVAYAVASTFGIETDTSSFNYLAAYSKGFELQDFNKSLDVIYKETQALTADIKAELDMRGLNLDLTEKPKEMLTKETLMSISTKYVDFATNQDNDIQAAISELPSLVKQNKDNSELIEILKYQKINLDSRKSDIDTILDTVESLNKADTREKQDNCINKLDTIMKRVNNDTYAFENFTERFITISESARDSLKAEFEKDPLKTLETMKKNYPTLVKLSQIQLEYIAKSKFVSHEFVKLLRHEPEKFVEKITERANLLTKVAAKNGTFIEVNSCEQWTDKKVFKNGTLCSPKIAELVIAGSEAQIRGFKIEAEKRGEYFPDCKCDITIFTPNKNSSLTALNTQIHIGNNEQKNLKDHLEQVCQRGTERKEVLSNFQEALTERANKNKIKVQDISEKSQGEDKDEADNKKENLTLTQEQWNEKIQEVKEQDTNIVGNDKSKMSFEKNKE